MGWEVLERDCLLSWILAGISRHERLCETLVFKGGTALKKCYLGDYRFSEDLDFSGLAGVPVGGGMEAAIDSVCRTATELLDEHAPVRIVWERYTERDPHPGGQEAFSIRAQLPWQRTPQTRALVEVAVDEPILKVPSRRRVIHDHGEPLEADVQVDALEEIIAEKLRAILQHRQMLEERGVGFQGLGDFFDDAMLAYVERTWSEWPGNLVPDLPTFEQVMGELRPQVGMILKTA
jgi:predicted nucleotidyltransferase component of viral defense system